MTYRRSKSWSALLIFVALSTAVTLVATRSFAFSGGDGTVANPYGVSSCADFMSIDDATTNLSKAYELTGNIDCSATSMSPLKNGSTYFTGTFDGKGYSITGVSISCTTADCGLFARLGTNAVVKNFTLTSPSIVSTSTYVGAIAGRSGSSATISNITVSGGSVSTSYSSLSLEDPSYVGGIVGSASSGTISGITSSATVSGKNHTGGIVGNGSTATLNISDVAINGNVTGESWVGGVIGNFYNSAAYGLVITHAAVGAISISGWQEVGGFLGYGWNIKVDSSTSLANVTGRGISISSSGIGEGAMVGGFAGQLSGGDSTFIDSYVRGDVTATYLDFNATRVGGVVGWARLTNLYVTRSSYVGTVTGYQYVAGVAGQQSLYSSVTDSYFRANLVTSTTTLNGGFVGSTSNTTRLTRSYYAGTQSAVAASRYGVAGSSSSGVTTCTNAFFDAGLLGSLLTSQSSGVCTGIGKTTTEMKTQSTFSGFDFTPGTGVWLMSSSMNDGYPFHANPGGVPVDITPPTATWTEPSSPRTSRTMSFTLTFSESVSGIASGDFSNAGTATGCTFAPSGSTASPLITVSVTCASDGTVIARLAANGVEDSAANVGPSSSASASTVLIDTSIPTATWTAPSSPRTSRTMSFTLTFSESVSGIASGDFSNTGTATGCSFAPSGSTASPSITVSVTCNSDGTVIARLAANAVTDSALNTGPISAESSSTVTIEQVPSTPSSTPTSTTLPSSVSAPTNTTSPSNTSTPVTTVSNSPVSTIATETTAPRGMSEILSSTTTTLAGSDTLRSNSSPNSSTTSSTSTTLVRPEPVLSEITVPDTAVGGASALIDGKSVTAEITRVNNELKVQAGPIAARIWGVTATGAKVPLDADGRLRLMRGDLVTVDVEGFLMKSVVEVRMYSEPLLLGRSTVPDGGRLSASYQVPESVETGNHRVIMLGETNSGDATFSLSIVVGEKGKRLTTWLITIPLVIAAIGALILPVALRRRRRTS